MKRQPGTQPTGSHQTGGAQRNNSSSAQGRNLAAAFPYRNHPNGCRGQAPRFPSCTYLRPSDHSGRLSEVSGRRSAFMLTSVVSRIKLRLSTICIRFCVTSTDSGLTGQQLSGGENPVTKIIGRLPSTSMTILTWSTVAPRTTARHG